MKIDIRKGEPLTLPNGDILIPKSMSEDGEMPEVKPAALAGVEQEMREILGDPFEEVTYHRTLADINIPFDKFSITMVCVSMSMWGLDAHAISRVINIDVDAITNVMETQNFAEYRKQIVEALRYAESGTIHGYLQQKALKAAMTVAGELASKDRDRALVAAKDILDRSGYRPVDRVEHAVRFDDELRIVVMEEKELPRTNFKVIDN